MSDVAKSLNFAERLAALARVTAFPFALPPDEQSRDDSDTRVGRAARR